MSIERREFLKQFGGVSIGATMLPSLRFEFIDHIASASRSIEHLTPEEAARDEAYWDEVRKAFDISSDFINLENGYFSPQPSVVLEAQIVHMRTINSTSSRYMRTKMEEDRIGIRKELAAFAGCSVDELAIMRNTTEALDTIICGLNLNPGDEAIMTDQDYGSMLAAFAQQSKRLGIVNKMISLPLHPESSEEIVRAFEQAITPRTKVMLVTHMLNRSGQILPVKAICKMARAHGVETIVDAAHSFAHIDFKISDLDCDYLGASLHKWLCAPLGTGFLYIRKEKIPQIWSLFGDTDFPVDNIRKFEHQGTQPCASYLAVSDAIRFHNAIGAKRKEARLRYLTHYWVDKVRALPGVILNTPMGQEQSCAIANIGIRGMKPAEIADSLFKIHRIFTVAIDTEAVQGVRITPHVFTSLNDLDLLIEAITTITMR